MSELVKAIRYSMRDQRLEPYELDNLVDLAAKEGVTVAKINAIVKACEQSQGGFTPVMRANGFD